ncbi:TetR/AcrR family transcriptional regulator C-terminal domain-containing protein [Actinomycetaceae bacterium MB13-C1-2]|nr:TetR/AcrR family transcriptional regulator C-terminal domain-containing protein [Actinomycetaceae bacterium MB13-C1-2]
MSSSTRDILGRILKDQLRTAPLDRITVSGLTSAAGINRQTFYYHFADVYDLAVWVFEQDVANHIMEHASYDQWAEGYRTLLQYMRQNYDQTLAVINSLDHRERDAFFLRQFRAMMSAIVTELQGDLVLSDEDRRFVIDHFAAIVLGHFLQWLVGGAKEDPDVLVPKIEMILRGTVRESLERFAK